MDAQALRQERQRLFDNALEFKPNPRTPLFANFWTWKYLDAGYNLNTALRDYEILEKATRGFHELYQFDSYVDLGTRNAIRVSDAFGAVNHYVNAAGDAVLVDDRCLIELEEFGEFMDNPPKFMWEKAFKRYCRDGLTLKEFRIGVEENIRFGEFGARMNDIFANEYGTVFSVPAGAFVMTPFEYLFNTLRGMKELSLDVRKHKSELKELMDFLWGYMCEPAIDALLDRNDDGCIASVNIGFLAHSVLSVSQFGELYWPYVKRVIDAAEAKGKVVFVFCEAEMIRLAEFFQDIPKGVLFVHPEQDDIFEFRKTFPNIAVAGGMPTHLLGLGTPEECVSHARRLVEEMGPGYVFSTDKMMSFRKDARRENLLAVTDFVRNHAL